MDPSKWLKRILVLNRILMRIQILRVIIMKIIRGNESIVLDFDPSSSDTKFLQWNLKVASNHIDFGDE